MENFSQLEHMVLNGRNIWHYMVDTPIGEIHAVQYEAPDLELHTTLIYISNQKAEKLFKKLCKDMIAGKI